MVKKRSLALVLIVVMVMMIMSLSLAACGYESGDEVGSYYVKVADKEYNITLKDKGELVFKVGDKDMAGSYKIEGTTLSIKLDDKTELSATYADGKISLTYNDEKLEFIRDVEFTVSFETNGGNKIDAVKVRNGEMASMPVEPTRNLYGFVGWFSDKELTKAFNFAENKITSDTTIYAKWSYVGVFNEVTLKNDAVATTVNKKMTVQEGHDFILEVPTLKATYGFVGWYTADGVKITDKKGNSIKAWDPALGDVELVPHYIIDLTYEELEDGTIRVSGNKSVSYLEDLTIPAYYDGKAVTVIGEFAGFESLKSVTIPATAKVISDNAFAESKVLAEHKIADVEGVTPYFTAVEGVIYADEGATLVRYPIAKEGASFTVPAAVTKIGDYAFYGVREGKMNPVLYDTLNEVIMPANLVSVGDYAFHDRCNLNTITFDPTSTTELTIGDGAFQFVGLKDFAMPANVVSIGNGAFLSDMYTNMSAGGAYKMTFVDNKIVLPEGLKTVGDNAFEYCATAKEVVFPASVESIGARVFGMKGMFGLKSVTLTEGIKIDTIPEGMFDGTGLASFVFPSSITTIGERAFANSKLVSVDIPATVTTIGDSAFAQCKSLTSISIPDTITSFGDSIFAGCKKLNPTSIKFPENNTYATIGEDGVLYSVDMTEIMLYPAGRASDTYVMPNTVTAIPNDCFSDCSNLVNITLSSNLKSIGTNAFFNDTKIKKLVIPASVESIANKAFTYMKGLEEVVFEEGSKLKTIGSEAFFQAPVKELILPEGVEVIGDKAFKDCASLTTISIPSSASTIGNAVLEGCSALSNITIGESNPVLKAVDNIVYSADMKTLISAPSVLPFDTFNVPDSVVEIADSAFHKNQSLKSINLNNVTKIGDKAFYEAVLESVDLSKIEVLGERSFAGTNLTSVDITNVKEMGYSVFQTCNLLTDVKFSKFIEEIPNSAFGNTGLTEVVLPAQTKIIGNGAFGYNKNITKIVLPEGVTMIDDQAFMNTPNLVDINIPSTVTYIGKDAFHVEWSASEAPVLRKSITIPANVAFIGEGAFDNAVADKIIVDAANEKFSSKDDGCLYNKDGSVLIATPVNYVAPAPEAGVEA